MTGRYITLKDRDTLYWEVRANYSLLDELEERGMTVDEYVDGLLMVTNTYHRDMMILEGRDNV